jgi:hypothetical protein
MPQKLRLKNPKYWGLPKKIQAFAASKRREFII